MTFDHELTLISKSYTTNSMGDTIQEETETFILCDVKSVTRSEHYSAAAHGLRPELVFEVNKFEYAGQDEVEFEGRRYNVTRTFAPSKSKGVGEFEKLELVCQGVVNNGSS
ncbi:phage head-tail adapter protein [Anaerobacillus alkalilacustris]|uniref:Phage head-tail adapter protein n=1 Tax=Anaerobacillus alkalilacustris TaxID=393763 RepID=A0A1S2LX48_9BACI|nr:phage head closure protein [Anaerobacillus alkalilacustris]OIJ17098.1 phage head-tail adapter protein [Anaerobacillus alkalilacustris]